MKDPRQGLTLTVAYQTYNKKPGRAAQFHPSSWLYLSSHLATGSDKLPVPREQNWQRLNIKWLSAQTTFTMMYLTQPEQTILVLMEMLGEYGTLSSNKHPENTRYGLRL